MKEGIKILVGFDGSDHATRALLEAADITMKYKGSVTILSALPYEPADINVPGRVVHDTKEMKELEELQTDVERSLKPLGVNYEYTHDEGYDAGLMILKHAKNGDYNLIIVGKRGLKNPTSDTMGSVSIRVANGAQCNVLIVS
jgi:nucleotide-binding universal stress UspA family protein